ncbi:MAG: type II toxin-antitoxin system PemK/MazF family toxin [Candidatus Dormibacteria bacterium]
MSEAASPRRVEPGQVWFVDFEPIRGRGQGKDRPALVVSSPFHLGVATLRRVAMTRTVVAGPAGCASANTRRSRLRGRRRAV